MAKFEAHATFDIKDADTIVALGKDLDWKYSQIDGDALMGAKTYCYLTAYDPDGRALHQRLAHVALSAKDRGVDILRGKIERIIYDTKTGVDELTDAWTIKE